ncbi:MAG: hypothetical protein UW07_C0018G0017 [Candidatus Nomurabacteria bacterium GW2011_GWF2_43_8]|uniref:Uncharacterized protein n=3 Tax=Candidatus Nomuraibacteriota TaxID=1752729 RepID=A0A0G1FP95_9BACT|nr:MAG: hypothetical protein UV76_C0012G0009 [Candidatus Nomurabacteria bacterium GW2011_GWA2_43_15]KKT18822.1 MAG: hypothetical protein UW02_C0021G0020 [Candidatus Nomurabacteria bacterium GW2011_GWB1_43_7]KKT24316.1 MAG: hypothetical protein UW07_C0018G0017 [Candidatus Nomurabacteria bacterium GW2011_GWF2_43_8]
MIPRAKKNLHECAYHLDKMVSANHLEDLEISFAAFVNSARSVTFILQKEYKDNESFLNWYGNSDFYKDGRWIGKIEEPKDSKIYQMAHDELCKFFVTLRNQITKEGINGFVCNTRISSFNSSSDLIDRPPNSSIQIGGNGIYYLVGEKTSKEDRIPARTRAKITTEVFIKDTPSVHLGISIPDSDRHIIGLSVRYYEYLKSLVEEWTGIINKS